MPKTSGGEGMMTKQRRTRLAQMGLCCAMLALAGPTHSAERSEWAVSGNWQILVDPETGQGCLMRHVQPDGLVVELGAFPARDGAFFAAYHPDWTERTAGEAFDVEFHFDDTGFAGEAIEVEQDGMNGGLAYFNNMAFVDEFAKRNSVTVVGPEGDRFDVSLKGTSKAIQAVRKCQEEQTPPT